MLDFFRQLFKKKTIKNGIWMYIMQIFNTIIPLFTLPYITRILGASQYGIFSIALNLLGYFQVVVEYGFGMSATRKVALANENDKKINKIFTSVLISRIILFVCCFFVAVGYFYLNNTNTEGVCLFILMISLLGNCIQLNWLFQGMQQMEFISVISIISRTISVILIFLFVKGREQLFLYCLLFSITPFINGILGLLIAKKQYHIQLVKIGIKDIIDELKEGWYVFTTQLSSKVFGTIGITLLGFFSTNIEVGIYSAINKLPNMIILAWMPIAQVMYPVASKKMSESFVKGYKFVSKVQRIILLPLVLVIVSLSIFSYQIIMIAYGNEYANYYYWVIPLLLWLVVAINNNFLGIQTLLASGHDREYSKCFQVGVMCTIILNFILIHNFGGNGACIAPLISELVLGLLLYRKIKKIIKIESRSF